MMVRFVLRPGWLRAHSIASWFLIVVFSFFTAAHFVLTVLFLLGIWDTGVGFVLNWEWPAWVITITDGTAVWLLWSARRARDVAPRRAMVDAVLAALIVVSRAAWMVLVPVAAGVTLVDAGARLAAARRT